MNRLEYLTVAEVAKTLRASEEAILALVAEGLLPAVDIGGEEGYRISREDLHGFLHRQKETVRVTASREMKGMWQTRKALNLLAEWMQQENHGLVGFYQKFEESIDRAVQKLQEEVNAATQKGDPVRGKAFHRALEIIYDKWERPRKTFHHWLLGQEKRWYRFRTESQAAQNREKPYGPFLKELEEIIGDEPLPAAIMGRNLSRAREEIGNTDSFVHWHHEERALVQSHHKRLERGFRKTCAKLRDEAKNASKELDFVSSQIFYEARRLLYQEWEKVSQKYNNWLLRRPERWRKFKDEAPGTESSWPALANLGFPELEVGEDGGEEEKT